MLLHSPSFFAHLSLWDRVKKKQLLLFSRAENRTHFVKQAEAFNLFSFLFFEKRSFFFKKRSIPISVLTALLSILLSLFFACTDTKHTTYKNSLTIAVAANAQFAMDDIGIAFEQSSGIKVNMVTGSSGKLTAQITHGAPFDLFFSANMKYPLYLQAEGWTTQAPNVYAYGKLALWTLHNLDLDKGLTLLTSPDIKNIAIGNPELAPYGIAAQQAFEKLGIYDQIKDKLVFGESISQVNQYIHLKSVDIGLTSFSTVLKPKLKGQGHWTAVSTDLYEPIAQGVAFVKQKTPNPAAQQFYDFVQSEEGKAILKKYGYEVVNDKEQAATNGEQPEVIKAKPTSKGEKLDIGKGKEEKRVKNRD